MRREDAEHLVNHHRRLYTSIRKVVDTSPPVSLYASPKSTYYQPFAMRKPKSAEAINPPKNTRRKGREELAHFLALKRTRSHSLGFNSFARTKTESCLNLTELAKPNVRSKLLDSRSYQPPLRLRLNSADSSSSSGIVSNISDPLPPRPVKIIRGNLPSIYDQFKDRVLSDILLRGVFTNRVIVDSFQREIAKHPDLDHSLLESIMAETLAELGVKEHKKTTTIIKPKQKHVTISEPKRKARSASISSSSQASFSTNQSIESEQPVAKPRRKQKKTDDQTTKREASNSSQDFRIDASPPRTVSSSSSDDIEELARRLSNTDSLLDSVASLDTEQSSSTSSQRPPSNSELNRIIERAKRKA